MAGAQGTAAHNPNTNRYDLEDPQYDEEDQVLQQRKSLMRMIDPNEKKDLYISRRLEEDLTDDSKEVVAHLRIFPNGDDLLEEVNVPLRTGINIVGRSSNDTDVTIVARGVSGIHALIEISASGTEHFIEDLGSTNGTSIGASSFRITPFRCYELSHMKEIKFEPVSCRYEITEGARKKIEQERNVAEGSVDDPFAYLHLPSSNTTANNVSQTVLSGTTPGQRIPPSGVPVVDTEESAIPSSNVTYHSAISEQPSTVQPIHSNGSGPSQTNGQQQPQQTSPPLAEGTAAGQAITPTSKQTSFAVPTVPIARATGQPVIQSITPTQLVSLTVPATQTLSVNASPAKTATPDPASVGIPATLIVPGTVPYGGIAPTVPTTDGTLLVDQDDRGSGSDGEGPDPSPSVRAAAMKKVVESEEDEEEEKPAPAPGLFTMLVDQDESRPDEEETTHDDGPNWDGETQTDESWLNSAGVGDAADTTVVLGPNAAGDDAAGVDIDFENDMPEAGFSGKSVNLVPESQDGEPADVEPELERPNDFTRWMDPTVPDDADEDMDDTDTTENVESVTTEAATSAQRQGTLNSSQTQNAVVKPGGRRGKVMVDEEDGADEVAESLPTTRDSDAPPTGEPVGLFAPSVNAGPVAGPDDDGDETEAEEERVMVDKVDTPEDKAAGELGAPEPMDVDEPPAEAEDVDKSSSLGFGFTAAPVGRRRGATYGKRGKATAQAEEAKGESDADEHEHVPQTKATGKRKQVDEELTNDDAAMDISEPKQADTDLVDESTNPAPAAKRAKGTKAATTTSNRGRGRGRGRGTTTTKTPRKGRGKKVDEDQIDEIHHEDAEAHEQPEETDEVIEPTPAKPRKGSTKRGSVTKAPAPDFDLDGTTDDNVKNANQKQTSNISPVADSGSRKRSRPEEGDHPAVEETPLTAKRRKSAEGNGEEGPVFTEEPGAETTAPEVVSKGRKQKTPARGKAVGGRGRGKKVEAEVEEDNEKDAGEPMEGAGNGDGDVQGTEAADPVESPTGAKEAKKNGKGGKAGSKAKGKRKTEGGDGGQETEAVGSNKKRRTPASSRETTPAPAVDASIISATPLTRRASSILGDKEKPKVMFTGIADDDERRDVVELLGGTMVDSWHECTHLVTDKIRRTVKFLCCIAAGKYILDVKWLDACKKSHGFVDEAKFGLKDTKTEKQYAMSLSSTLRHTRETRIFNGYTFVATAAVRPPPAELSEIVSSGGGKCINVEELGSWEAEGKVTLRDGVGQSEDQQVVFVGSNAKEDESSICSWRDKGWRIMSVEVVLMGVLKGEVDLTSYGLPDGDNSKPGTAATSGRAKTPARKKGR
ncbi:Mediator of DNA damage checkpoint protein 1 [Rhizophlyctis rosea]|uniref:Mediator of DNA damage checkpoint protein 1 n=1 Tax=Rhizophlyctis rosea TaxID=64517 RepID=A0AAD5SHF4_9FUNG|nr:Mediator of DNA damage checkpoint protein 1 [Rhizophlyctis rosea]